MPCGEIVRLELEASVRYILDLRSAVRPPISRIAVVGVRTVRQAFVSARAVESVQSRIATWFARLTRNVAQEKPAIPAGKLCRSLAAPTQPPSGSDHASQRAASQQSEMCLQSRRFESASGLQQWPCAAPTRTSILPAETTGAATASLDARQEYREPMHRPGPSC